VKLLQINASVNTGSTGRISEEIGRLTLADGDQSIIAYGYKSNSSRSETLKIGNHFHILWHGLKSRLLDLHGFGSVMSTRGFIEKLKKIDPDIIHLHNIHGYYLNVEVLFNYLNKSDKPVVWTLHDCWPFTGHCSHFEAVNCFKWEMECQKCPNLKGYPKSWILDNSKNNYRIKKKLFTGHKNLTIVTPSDWLAKHVRKSFLKACPVEVIHNGIDLSVFRPTEKDSILSKYKIQAPGYILGIANIWTKRKGLDDFYELRGMISREIQIVLVGLSRAQMKNLPAGIIGIARTENVEELATLYSAASVFVNPTYVDNFPSTNLESIACGTPVITYNTGGSPEAIDEDTGFVVEKGDLPGVSAAISLVLNKNRKSYTAICRQRAERYFDKNERFEDYLSLYRRLNGK
jgi:glycosyltransferase involved in cell wall biosynthesis